MELFPIPRKIPAWPGLSVERHALAQRLRVGISVAHSGRMRTRSIPRLIGSTAAAFVVLLAVIRGQSTVVPQAWPIAKAPAELRHAISRADVIIATMHDALLWELNSGLEQGGPTLAIKSCHIDAARVAQRIGRQEGVASGRTSDRLRNPLNTPRPWSAPLVEANAGKRAQHVDGFAVDLGDRVGVMRPIAQRARCASCHGRPEQFSTAIRDELKDRYPADRATGFEEGEIRGWYWVEIPKRPSR